MKKKLGFTLIELLAVLVILSIILLIAIPVINKVMVNAREKLYDTQISNIKSSAEMWAAKNVEELPKEEGNSITITLGQIKLAGLIKEEVRNPITEELFPNDMEIEITYTSNRYEYKVKEDSGTSGNNNPTLIIMVLKGKTHEYIEINTEYIDKGVTAKDPTGRIIEEIEITTRLNMQTVDSIDTSRLGQYTITYSAEYEGEKTSINRTVTVRDTIPPVITISGNREIKLSELENFDLTGLITTSDNSEMSVRVEVEGSLVSIPGKYNITYKAYDESNNEAIKTIEITVIDDIEPIVSYTPNGNSTYAKTHTVKINVSDQHGSIASSNYIWTASEEEPEMINQSFVDNENIQTPAGLNGTYYIWVKATDNSGNEVIVRSNAFRLDNESPIITVPSNTVLKINEVTGYNLLTGVSVTDNSGETPQIIVEGSLSKIAGSYTITYRATDSSGNTGVRTRVIDVIDVEAPVITIIGSTTINVNVGTAYTDGGATAIDDADGNVTANITVTNPVNVNVPGTYTVTYRVKDSSNNESSATRTVNVIDNVAPTIEAYAGSMLYKDPTFASGNNSTGVYNNTGNGNVIHTRKAISGIPGGSSYGLEIKTVGEATPGHGGFRFATPTSASKTYVTRILAKIPVGYNIAFASNATGDGSTRVWLTSTAGTGKWEEYIHRVVTGSTGTFSSTNYYYLTGGSIPTTSNPLIWEVGYATVIEVGKWDTTYNIITYSKDAHSTINSHRVQLSSTILASKTYNPAKKEFGEIVSNLTSNGTYNIYSKDIHGNERTTSVAINRIDRTGPVISAVTIDAGSITTNSYIITRTGNASDAGAGLTTNPYIYQTSPNGSTWTTICTNNSTSCNISGLSEGTTYYYRLCVNDALGNQSCTASKTVTTSRPPRYLYYLRDTSRIYQCDLNEGTCYTFVNPDQVMVAVTSNDHYVYYVRDSGTSDRIYQCDLSGNGCSTFVSTSHNIVGITANNQYVYYLRDSNRIYQCDLSGNSCSSFANPGHTITRIVSDNQYVYYLRDTTRIYQCDSSTGSCYTFVNPGHTVVGVTPNNQYVYYVRDSGTSDRIYQCDLSGNGCYTFVSTSHNIVGLTTNNQSLYYIRDSTRIYQCDLNDSTCYSFLNPGHNISDVVSTPQN